MMKFSGTYQPAPTRDHGDKHWSSYPAGSQQRIEALFFDGVRMGLSASTINRHVGLTFEEMSALVRRLLDQGRLSKMSRYAKLRDATERTMVRRQRARRERGEAAE